MDIEKLSPTLNKPQQSKLPFNPERDVEDHSLPYVKLQLNGKVSNDDLAGDITPSKIAFTGLENIVGSIGNTGNRGTNPFTTPIINIYNGYITTGGATTANYTWTFSKKFTSNFTFIVLVNGWDNNNGSSTAGNPNFYATEGSADGSYCILCARNLSAAASAVGFQAIAIGY